MKIQTVLELIGTTEFEDEDGFKFKIEMQNALTEKELNRFKESLPDQSIHPDLEEILKTTRGWEDVFFDSLGHFGFESLLKNSIRLSSDGFGNFWVLDVKSKGRLGNVYFVCHDPPAFVIQSRSLGEYLNHLFYYYQNPIENFIHKVHDIHAQEIWESDLGVENLKDFILKNPEFYELLSVYEEKQWYVSDLRDKEIGAGFPWAISGSNTQIIRLKEYDIWLLERKHKESIWKRLFG